MCGGRHHQSDSITGYAPGLIDRNWNRPSASVSTRPWPVKFGSSGASWRSFSLMYLPDELACQISITTPATGAPSSSTTRPSTEMSCPIARRPSGTARDRSPSPIFRRRSRLVGPVSSDKVAGRSISGCAGVRVKLRGYPGIWRASCVLSSYDKYSISSSRRSKS